MTWGVEGNVLERFGERGRSRGEDRLRHATRSPSTFPGPRRVRGGVPELLRPDHERVRGGREDGRAEELQGSWRRCSQPEQEREPGVDLDPRDLPARHRRTLTPKETDMTRFALPRDLSFNTEKVADPSALAQERRAASWLYLNGEEFAVDGGKGSPLRAGPACRPPPPSDVISNPPRLLDLELARQHVAALDELPRPTLVTRRPAPACWPSAHDRACGAARMPTRCSPRPSGTARRSASSTTTSSGFASRLTRSGAKEPDSSRQARGGSCCMAESCRRRDPERRRKSPS